MPWLARLKTDSDLDRLSKVRVRRVKRRGDLARDGGRGPPSGCRRGRRSRSPGRACRRDPKPPKPAVPGDGAETVAGVGVPEAVAGVDHHEAELDAGAVPRPPKPDGRGGEAEALAGVGVPEAVAGVDAPEAELDAGAEAVADIPDVKLECLE